MKTRCLEKKQIEKTRGQGKGCNSVTQDLSNMYKALDFISNRTKQGRECKPTTDKSL